MRARPNASVGSLLLVLVLGSLGQTAAAQTSSSPCNHPGCGNRAPIANAGPDQTVGVGATVRLDGSASSDPDGAPLTFRWSFTSMPTGSTAVLQNPTTVSPTFVADVPGTYAV